MIRTPLGATRSWNVPGLPVECIKLLNLGRSGSVYYDIRSKISGYFPHFNSKGLRTSLTAYENN